MRKFLFQTDHWILDGITVIVFALCMSAFVQIGADSGERHLDRILWAMFWGGLSYVLTIIFALSLRRKITIWRSWLWAGGVGALVQILVYELVGFHYLWEYHQRFPSSYSVINLLLDLLTGLVWNWFLWAILGCTLIFAIRFFAYFFHCFIQRGPRSEKERRGSVPAILER